MGIITVSRMYGAGGTYFAQELAKGLGWKFVDKDVLQDFCIKNSADFCQLGCEEEDAPSFFERFRELMDNKSFYKVALMASMYSIALKESVVFAGRGAHLVMSGISDVINLQVVRLFSDRVRALADAKGISLEAAEDLARKKDAEKKEFISYYFDRDIFDPLQFHMVINSSHVLLEHAVEIICSYGQQYFSDTAAAKARAILQLKLIEARAELLLFKLDLAHGFGKIHFEAQQTGNLLVSGVIGGEAEKKKLLDALAKMPGVLDVTDHLKVGILSHIIY